ncbi:PREDICTED: beta-defensin 135 [Chinchilla lanigera]|uniref:beta-defensin 135 n=1 Tax=Chinchilla lanigera TaxID=34839 RepID=UPI0006986266|nr:PREDICTED: beta-defensin 135 [Chinchilla lanigera]
MRSLLLVFVVLVLLPYVPPVRSGPNQYIRQIFSSCWRMKGSCKIQCAPNEIYHIFCDSANVCCIEKKHLPILVSFERRHVTALAAAWLPVCRSPSSRVTARLGAGLRASAPCPMAFRTPGALLLGTCEAGSQPKDRGSLPHGFLCAGAPPTGHLLCWGQA